MPDSVNPATAETRKAFTRHDDTAVRHAIDTGARAFGDWRGRPIAERAKLMHAAADLLDARRETLARLATEEMGKRIAEARSEVEKCAWVCRYYADNAESLLADEPVETDARRSFKRYLPIGPVLAVMPWNFPFWQVFRFAAPALMAGNTGLLKHASNVPRSALAIESVFERAGFADGAFSTLLIESGRVANVLRDNRVRAATLTGSGPAGSAVAEVAGAGIKKTVLELGGSDPFIVMPSADLDAAVETAVTARIQNNGQSCIAAKRFIVHTDVYDAFRDAFVAAFEALEVGDPEKGETDVGPLATQQGRADCVELVEQLEGLGAHRLVGAEAIDGRGYFFRPGIVEVPSDRQQAFDEEIFGPVALMYRADSLDDALALGNATQFGLGSAIFSADEDEIDRAVDRLDAGSTFVNAMVASHPHLPFGGVKSSGYGRELSSEGIREFMNVKSVYVA